MRYRISAGLLAVFAFVMGSAAAQAQQYPNRPIRIFVGFGPGAGVDSIARLYGRHLQQELNVPVVVENRPGAFQLLAIRPVLGAAPDGYTLFTASASSLITTPSIRSDLGYDPLRDFSPVAMLVKSQAVLTVSPDFPGATLEDLIGYARANPGRVNFASAGIGAANHVLFELLMRATDVAMVHVPFRSDPEAVIGISTGTVQTGMLIAQTAVPFVRDGRLRALAVTGSRRAPFLPEVPSFGESENPMLRGVDAYTFGAIVGPSGMPPEIVRTLNATLNRISARPEVIAEVTGTLFSDPPVMWSPDEFRQYLDAELAKWRDIGRGIRIN